MHVESTARRIRAIALGLAALAIAAGAAFGVRGCGDAPPPMPWRVAMSVSFDVGVALDARLRDFDQRLRAGVPELLEAVGAEVESQTKRRIHDEKTAPDGTRWKPWSDRYELTRHGGQSLLESEGELLKGIQFVVEASRVSVGSPDEYAAHMFFGSPPGTHFNIAGRQALGLSDDNVADLEASLSDWLADLAG